MNKAMYFIGGVAVGVIAVDLVTGGVVRDMVSDLIHGGSDVVEAVADTATNVAETVVNTVTE